MSDEWVYEGQFGQIVERPALPQVSPPDPVWLQSGDRWVNARDVLARQNRDAVAWWEIQALCEAVIGRASPQICTVIGQVLNLLEAGRATNDFGFVREAEKEIYAFQRAIYAGLSKDEKLALRAGESGGAATP